MTDQRPKIWIRTVGWGSAVSALFCGLTWSFLVPGAASGDFVLVEPQSEVYRELAVTAGGDLKVGKRVSVLGSVHSERKVVVEDDAVVAGDVSAGETVDLKGDVSGSVIEGAPHRELPAPFTESAARAMADRVFESDVEWTNVVVDDVVFVDGKVKLWGSMGGAGTIIASNDIEVMSVQAGAGPSLLTDGALLSLVAFQHVKVLENRRFRGAILAGSDVIIEKAVTIEGVLVARNGVELKESSTVIRLPPDLDPPVVWGFAPANGNVLGASPPEIRASFDEGGAGLREESFSLRVDGEDRTEAAVLGGDGFTYRPSFPLDGGTHTVEVSIADRARNIAAASWSFAVDLEPPAVTLTQPADGALLGAPAATVTGTVVDDVGVRLVTVNGVEASVAEDIFTADVGLNEGLSQIVVVATDRFGREATAAVSVILDLTPPLLSITHPNDGHLVNSAEVAVRGEVRDDFGVALVEIAGKEVPLDNDRFEAVVELSEGPSSIQLRARDLVGNETIAVVGVTRFSLPEVVIGSPPDLSFIGATAVDVSGTVSEGATVEVNGVVASVTGAGFHASGVPLIEGGNVVTATATDTDGHVVTDSVHVVRDVTPPRISIDYPTDGATVFEPQVSVRGLVNDIVAGTVNAPDATVTVNGTPAEVANRSFHLPAFALAPGENEIVVEAVDFSGNASVARASVYLETAPASRVVAISGNGQSAVIGAPLPEPLVVEVRGVTGLPVSGIPVVFKVRGTNGHLDDGTRLVAVTSDAAGRASASFTLGTRVGVGNQVVQASTVGFAPAVFTATALAAEPSRIMLDAGGLQYGIAGRELPRPLVATVTDAGHNRISGASVLFRVPKGGGLLPNGLQEAVVTTDSDGRAITGFTLDPEEGIANNVVEAVIEGLPDSPVASFVASGRTAGDPAQTSVSGVVLDNTNRPIEGATLRIKGTTMTAVTDAQGQFRIAGAPVGSIKLIVDGSTANRPGSWPDLEFDLVTVPGRDNTVNMPIFLLPLDLEHGIFVDEGTGGTLTLPNMPGFALEVAPGSVTFPSGGRSGLVSATVVHSDKVPMVPNFGQQPRLIVTIQPAGARFEPPAELSIPNVDGLAPGEVTEMYSFDHDLGHFVSIGPATVSDDGTIVTSNPGVGILKAGWHCGGNPAGSGTTHDCPQCQSCVNNRCQADDGKSPPDRPKNCRREICRGGSPASEPDDSDAPENLHPDDCIEHYCSGGRILMRTDINETPPQIPGNCQREKCPTPAKEPDNGDIPPGGGCCEGNPYSLQSECCTPSGVQPKTPISDLDDCPGRVPRQGYTPTFNGCTGSPENPNLCGPAFTPACNNHDVCYGTCLSDRGSCDGVFLTDLLALCATVQNPICKADCDSNALIYYHVVLGVGHRFWEGGQKEACQCCA
ncbi:MAG TPA: carboxypeptidase regulatory-like domain-containing protein [Acidimicrobiia bacterium]|nr:carboxypeptidase regulatory-like domain-containing protein [Acidimicrobiia bacterium]